MARIALRVLALYLIIRAIEVIITTIAFHVTDTDWKKWLHIGASVVPLLAGTLVWIYSERLSARISRKVVVDVEEGRSEKEPEPASTSAFLSAALVVLGVYVVVTSVGQILYYSIRLAFHSTYYCPFRGELTRCPFWDRNSVTDAVNLGAWVLRFGLGAWLVTRPQSLPQFIRSVRAGIRRMRGTLPPEEPQEEPLRSDRGDWGPPEDS